MKARIIGSEQDLGDVRDGVTILGFTLFRDKWTDISPTEPQAEKLRGNRFVQLQGDTGGKDAEAELAANRDAAQARVIKDRLNELGAKFKDDEKLSALQSKLDKAEKGEKAEEDAIA